MKDKHICKICGKHLHEPNEYCQKCIDKIDKISTFIIVVVVSIVLYKILERIGI